MDRKAGEEARKVMEEAEDLIVFLKNRKRELMEMVNKFPNDRMFSHAIKEAVDAIVGTERKLDAVVGYGSSMVLQEEMGFRSSEGYRRGTKTVLAKEMTAAIQENDLCTVSLSLAREELNRRDMGSGNMMKILRKTVMYGNGLVVVESINGPWAHVVADGAGAILGGVDVPLAALRKRV